jgi:hypothetical protein
MLSQKEILENFAKSAIETIRKNMKEKDIDASGKSSKSLRYEVTNDAAKVYGALSLEAVEFGRKPTREQGYVSGDMSLVDAIKQWIANKGLDLNPYAVANKIHKEGTKQYRKGGRRGLLDGIIQENSINNLLIDISRVSLSGGLIKKV